jgi:hypothetical protein
MYITYIYIYIYILVHDASFHNFWNSFFALSSFGARVGVEAGTPTFGCAFAFFFGEICGVSSLAAIAPSPSSAVIGSRLGCAGPGCARLGCARLGCARLGCATLALAKAETDALAVWIEVFFLFPTFLEFFHPLET